MKKDNQNARKAQVKRVRKAAEVDLGDKKVEVSIPVESDREPTPEELEELNGLVSKLKSVDSNTTAQAFVVGGHLRRAKEVLSQKKLSAWLKAHTSYSVRSAWNYINFVDKLDWHRERLEKAAVPPTTMFVLAGADDKQIESVLAYFESGKRLTGTQVKALIAPAPDNGLRIEPLNVGAAKGFLKAAEFRLRRETARFHGLLASVLTHVEAAVATMDSGKNVAKKTLAEAIEIDARHAHDIFLVTLAPVAENRMLPSGNWTPGKLDAENAWGKTQCVLRQLGGQNDWPGREEFRRWLAEEVLPVLKFAVKGEPLPGFAAEVANDQSDGAEPLEIETGEAVIAVERPAVPVAIANVIPLARRKQIDPGHETA